MTAVPGRANSKSARSNAARRGPSRCSITSTTAAASKPASRWSRYSNDPCRSRTRSRCFSGRRPETPRPSLSAAISSDRSVHADDLAELLLREKRLEELPFAAPEVEHARRSAIAQDAHHGGAALLVEADRPLELGFL